MKRLLGSTSSSKSKQNQELINEDVFVDEAAHQDIPGSSKKISNRNKTSKVWCYFELKDEKAICRICKERFAHKHNSGTGTITRHLNKMHQNWDTSDLLDEAVQQNIEVLSSGAISNYTYKQDEVRDEIAKMVIGAELPFNFVQSHYFTNVMKKAQPRYKSISRNTTYKDAFKIYENEIIDLKNLFATLSSKISLTTDLWLGRQGLHYLCITAHWVNEDFILEKRIIEFSCLEHPHDGLSIYQAIMSCLNYWEISDKIMSISLDNASNNGRAIDLLKDVMKSMFNASFFHIRCVCHILHLCVSDGMQSVKPHIDIIRDCLLFILSSSIRLQKYRKMVKNAKMKFKVPYIDVKTRWSSTYRMLMEAKPYSSIIIRFIKEENTSRIQSISESDWEIIDILVPLLQQFSEMTTIMSGCFYPTSNMMLISMVSIVNVFREHRTNGLVGDIIKKMEIKWRKYYESVPYCAMFAHIFDPRLKLSGCEVYLEEYYACIGSTSKMDKKQLNDFLEALFSLYCSHHQTSTVGHTSTSSNKNSGGSSRFTLLDKLKKQKNTISEVSTYELAHYLSNPLVNDSEDFNILNWWKVEQKVFPILSIIARDVLTIQMSSVASESAFSAGARTITDRRTRLNPKSIKCCMLLKNWLDEEYRMKNLKRFEKYKIAEMNEDEEDGEPDIQIVTLDDEPDIERFYFPTTNYYYSSAQDPGFTYEWQQIPD